MGPSLADDRRAARARSSCPAARAASVRRARVSARGRRPRARSGAHRCRGGTCPRTTARDRGSLPPDPGPGVDVEGSALPRGSPPRGSRTSAAELRDPEATNGAPNPQFHQVHSPGAPTVADLGLIPQPALGPQSGGVVAGPGFRRAGRPPLPSALSRAGLASLSGDVGAARLDLSSRPGSAPRRPGRPAAWSREACSRPIQTRGPVRLCAQTSQCLRLSRPSCVVPLPYSTTAHPRGAGALFL